uniref:Uncharacterized protein n=1 Tax=Rhodosorus marinus TaxID=101924 RepID=A0A7S2ZV44_9RHOD|mmetsp:Transcript_3378/g.15940  ORF Transcript_3378/g.15940 Transcript_3378/m.15940 type:complete len:188 (+) Transcript_3378:125-688(+)
MPYDTAEFPAEPKFFGPEPKSGELTPYAAKLFAQLFGMLALIIVGVNTPQTVNPFQGIGIAVICLTYGLLVVQGLLIVLRTFVDMTKESGIQLQDNVLCTQASEAYIMLFISVVWAAIVWMCSSAELTATGIQGLVQVFAWLGLASALFAAFQAHLHRCEETENNEIHSYELRIGTQTGETVEAQYR